MTNRLPGKQLWLPRPARRYVSLNESVLVQEAGLLSGGRSIWRRSSGFHGRPRSCDRSWQRSPIPPPLAVGLLLASDGPSAGCRDHVT